MSEGGRGSGIFKRRSCKKGVCENYFIIRSPTVIYFRDCAFPGDLEATVSLCQW